MNFRSLFNALMLLLFLIPCNASAQDTSATFVDQLVEPRIIGGYEAVPGAWPSMVALVHANSTNPFWGQFCGGTLIDPEWVVTAAHCTEGSAAADIDIVVGVHDLRNDLASGIGERIGVKRIISHPDFNGFTLVNDIALLQLQQATSYLPAATHFGPETLAGVTATILGWGNMSTIGSNFPDVLQQAELPIVSNATCVAAYNARSITEDMLCAGYSSGGKDTCQGDSGGPLLIQGQSGWQLAGITSWGEGCAQPGKYGVYTRIANFQPFIGTTMTTDYFACADANADGLVDGADLVFHRNDLIAGLRDWLGTCWRPQSVCGDVNGDQVVNNADKRAKVIATVRALNEWKAVCWTPER